MDKRLFMLQAAKGSMVLNLTGHRSRFIAVLLVHSNCAGLIIFEDP